MRNIKIAQWLCLGFAIVCFGFATLIMFQGYNLDKGLKATFNQAIDDTQVSMNQVKLYYDVMIKNNKRVFADIDYTNRKIKAQQTKISELEARLKYLECRIDK